MTLYWNHIWWKRFRVLWIFMSQFQNCPVFPYNWENRDFFLQRISSYLQILFWLDHCWQSTSFRQALENQVDKKRKKIIMSRSQSFTVIYFWSFPKSKPVSGDTGHDLKFEASKIWTHWFWLQSNRESSNNKWLLMNVNDSLIFSPFVSLVFHILQKWSRLSAVIQPNYKQNPCCLGQWSLIRGVITLLG